ncbi:hypothetical protein L1887_52866 [Cichorium endivia]|nr:hypothetical protein L1887_52866 [Cichorium endivia]
MMRAHLRQCGCRFSGPAPSEKIGLISATATAAEQQQPPVTGAVAAGSVGSLSFWWSDVERALMNATLQRGELAQFFSSKIFKKKIPLSSPQRHQKEPTAKCCAGWGRVDPVEKGQCSYRLAFRACPDSTLTVHHHTSIAPSAGNMSRTKGKKPTQHQKAEPAAAVDVAVDAAVDAADSGDVQVAGAKKGKLIRPRGKRGGVKHRKGGAAQNTAVQKAALKESRKAKTNAGADQDGGASVDGSAAPVPPAEHAEKIANSLGFDVLKQSDSAKLSRWLLQAKPLAERMAAAEASENPAASADWDGTAFKKRDINPGTNRNNFAIVVDPKPE